MLHGSSSRCCTTTKVEGSVSNGMLMSGAAKRASCGARVRATRAGVAASIGTRATAARVATHAGVISSAMGFLSNNVSAGAAVAGLRVDHVAGRLVAVVAGRDEMRAPRRAYGFGEGAARVESAAGWRIDRVGRIAADRRFQRAPVRIERGHRSKQRARVGM